MKFRAAFEALTWTTAAWAFAILAVSAELHRPVIAIFIASFVAGLFFRRSGRRVSPRVEIVCSVLVLLAALYGWFIVGERLYSVIYLFLYLEIYKVWTARKNRDYLQVYALTFFQVLAASVSTASMFFAPGLVVYLFLMLASLITATIKGDAERALVHRGRPREASASDPMPVESHASRRLERLFRIEWLNNRFYKWIGATLAFVMVVGMGIFFVLPRVQAQSFFSGLGSGSGGLIQSGFSDGVDFTQVGEIQTDPTIVMRAIPIEGFGVVRGDQPDLDVLRLRGTALDNYDGRRWRKSEVALRSLQPSETRRMEFFRQPAFEGDSVRMRRMRINIEPNRRGFLFGLDRPVRFDFDNNLRLQVDNLNGSVQVDAENWSGPLSYSVLSAEPRLDWQGSVQAGDRDRAPRDMAGALRSLGGFVVEAYADMSGGRRESLAQRRDSERESAFLQLPAHPDIETVRRVATEWTGELVNPRDIAEKIEREFQFRFDYSLDNNPEDPDQHLTDFLDNSRAGHCEYFATAMALMLRTRDIPARIVNGYATDEWSAVGGGYYLVRQEHAHSWVEAWFPDLGWMTFDPTPPGGIGSMRIDSTWYRRYTAFMDGLKLLWYQVVIDYDMDDQRGFYIAMFRGMDLVMHPGRWLPSFGGAGGGSKGPALALLGLVFAALAWYLWREVMKMRGRRGVRRLLRRGAPVTQDERLLPYLELLEELAKLHGRPSSQTPLEYAKAVGGKFAQLGGFLPLTGSYYQARYDGHAWGDDEARAARGLREAVARIVAEQHAARAANTPSTQAKP